MSDISKCTGVGCPLKETCWRYKAPANEFWQSYLTEVPYNHNVNACEEYWKMVDGVRT